MPVEFVTIQHDQTGHRGQVPKRAVAHLSPGWRPVKDPEPEPHPSAGLSRTQSAERAEQEGPPTLGRPSRSRKQTAAGGDTDKE